MKIIKVNPHNPERELLQQAVKFILNDGVIGYPTETIYGLGANALSDKAVGKIFDLKQRDPSKPILIIAANLDQIMDLVLEIPKAAELLANSFWPGPLTIIFRAAPSLTRTLLGNGDSIGIRIPDNKICLELLKLCGVPLTSTSANLSDGQNPVSADEVMNNFGKKLDLIIDGGKARSRTPSSVLDLSTGKLILRREGVISKTSIEKTIGLSLDEIKTK